MKYIIGDWVKYLTVKTKVAEVYKDNTYYLESCRITECPKEEELSPIPLTMDILEKNGWKLKYHHLRKTYDDIEYIEYTNPNSFIILKYFCEDKCFLPFCCVNHEISSKDIFYVHEFQHLLFGLGLDSEMEV